MLSCFNITRLMKISYLKPSQAMKLGFIIFSLRIQIERRHTNSPCALNLKVMKGVKKKLWVRDRGKTWLSHICPHQAHQLPTISLLLQLPSSTPILFSQLSLVGTSSATTVTFPISLLISPLPLSPGSATPHSPHPSTHPN